jgi:hypothetical protein
MPAGRTQLESIRAPLPEGEPLAERYDRVRARPADDRALAFRMLVPKELLAVAEAERPPDRAPGDWLTIGAFRSEEGDAVEVAVMPLAREVSLADVVAWDIERFGLDARSVEALDFGGREAVDALSLRPAGTEGAAEGAGRLERAVLFRREGALVRLAASARAGRYAALAEPFAWSLSSFSFDEERPVAFLEPFVWTETDGALPLGFRRPAAWRCEERKDAPWGRQVLDLRRIEGGAVTDLLRAIALDRDTAPTLTLGAFAAEAHQGLRPEGLEPGPLRQRTAPPSPGAPFRAATAGTVHEGRAFGSPCEVRVACLETSRALYALAAVYASKATDRIAWMAGKRAFEVAYQSLLHPEEWILTPEGARRAAALAAGAPDPVAPVAGAGDEESAAPAGREEE